MHYVKAKGILSAKNGMNIYRGCTHGCIYCDSRSECYQMHHLFEDIEVKENALALLEDALKRKRKKCMIGCGSMSDPYMPIEAELKYVRGAEILSLKYGFGFSLITKSSLVLRDIDILKQINEKTKCVVQMTLTTFDEALCKKLEPNVSTSEERFYTLLKLKEAKIPTVVWLDPILPFINDTIENLDGILTYCKEAGVVGIVCFGMGVTMRHGNREYFYQQLDHLFPGMKEKYIRKYGNNYNLLSPNEHELLKFFKKKCAEYGIESNQKKVFQYLSNINEEAGNEQLSLF